MADMDDLANELVSHFASVAKPHSTNVGDYLNDEDGHTLEYYRGWIDGRLDAAGAISMELMDIPQNMPFWKYDLPSLIGSIISAK